MERLKSTQVKEYREKKLAEQGYTCALCKLPLTDDPVLDHDHKTGLIRAVLHRGCNALLGKLENGHRRLGVPDFFAFLGGVLDYLSLHTEDQTSTLHPTHRTPEQKKALAKKRQQRKRAEVRQR